MDGMGLQHKFRTIQSRPTALDGLHQSNFRSDAILRIVIYLLSEGTPPGVVLFVIDGLESLPELATHRVTTGKTYVRPEFPIQPDEDTGSE